MVLLAVSVSQFGLSFYLNQVWHHLSSRSRKISPFPVSSRIAKSPQIVSLSVKLHLNRLKWRNVFVSERTAVKIQYIQLIGINIFAVSFTTKPAANKHSWQPRNKLMCFMFVFPCIITLYYIKNQQDTAWALLFINHCKITLHVSDAFCNDNQNR